MTSAWKDQPRGQPANAGQFGPKPKVQADTPEAPAVDLGGQTAVGAVGTRRLEMQAILDSLPEGSATVVFNGQDLDRYGFPGVQKGDAGVLTSRGGTVPFPVDDRERATMEVLSLCERAFSDRAWGEYLSDQGITHAESYDRPPSESSCLDMAEKSMDLLAEDPDLLGEPPSSLAQRTMPSEMPVTAGGRPLGFRWMPASPTAEPPEAGVVYWSVGRLEDHDDRTQDVLNPEERRVRTGYMDTVYDDDHYEHRSMYLRMMSFEGYDEKHGHLKGFTETLVRYAMPNETDINGHVMAGYTKERKRQRNAGR